MKTVVQLFTGSITSSGVASLSDVRAKLQTMLDENPPYALITGWADNAALYEEIREFLKPYPTKLFLWYPAFAELASMDSFDPLISSSMEVIDIKRMQGSDGFDFYCPSSEKNISNTLRIFDEKFSSLPFDGVFLDRVRFPSFLAGEDGIFSCFCPHCIGEYKKLGLDWQILQQAAEKAKQRIREHVPNPLGLVKFTVDGWRCEDEALTAFFNARCKVIAGSLEKMRAHFAAQNKSLAYDLFTPSLGWFAGQGYKYMLPQVTFIKPMMYRHTTAPAGLPYEFQVYAKALGDPDEENRMLTLLGAGREKDYETFVALEMAHMMAAREQSGSRAYIFPGMETNRVSVAQVTAEMVGSDAHFLKAHGADGLTASWSLATTPEENLRAFLKETAQG